MAVSRASFYHSCLKMPVHPDTRMPSPGYERPSLASDSPSPARLTSRASKNMSRASSASGPRSRASSARVTRPPSARSTSTNVPTGLAPVLKFYESIPDYTDLNHLNDKDFYARVRELRYLQRNYISSMKELEFGKSSPSNWKTGLQGNKCTLNLSRAPTPHSASSSSMRIGSPWAKIAWGQVTNYKHADEILSSTFSSSPLSSPQRLKNKRPQKGRKRAKTPQSRQSSASRRTWNDSMLFLTDSEEEELKAERVRTKNVAWREPQFTVPEPFGMTRREEEERYLQLLRRGLQLSPSPVPSRRTPSPIRGHDVPLTSRLPMFHAILLEQEKRRERQKRRSKARLLSKVRPFSFDLSPRSPSPLKKDWKSLPELRDLDREPRPRSVFRAKPMPWQIYGVEAEIRRQEEDFLRQMRRQIRAEEMLAQSSLPNSMMKYSRCRSQSPEIRFSRVSSAVEDNHYNKRSPYASTANSRTTSRVSSAQRLVSPIRNNLASVLRIESCSRRRAEREAALRLEESRQLEEMRSRAKVVRRRPAWKRMANISARRDLALRTEARREEDRSQREEHARQMGTMMNRVLDIPTLFERQEQEGLRHKLLEAKAKAEEHRRKTHEIRKQRISFSPEEEKKDDEPEFNEKDVDTKENCYEIEEELDDDN